MEHDLTELLVLAAEAAFEQLGFLFPDFDDEDDDLPGRDRGVPGDHTDADAGGSGGSPGMMGMIVAYSGPSDGALLVRAEPALAATLAGNMLAADAPPSAALQEDALGEIANVICGNVLPVVDAAAVFRLERPRRVDGPAPAETVRAAASLRFEGGRADVALVDRPG